MFTGCLLLFLAAMTLTAAARNFGLLWVAVEATTLASAPLVFFHRHARSLEAVWKYLVVCSVGIALALGGNIFLAASGAGGGSPLGFDDLARMGPALNATWLRAALVFLFVGYGTKMGLAPMHTWLPDAHSESPSVVSALLSGALLNCAFLALWRASRVAAAAGQGKLADTLFLALGAASLGVAAIFILGQSDYKRLLAYSSVEHMGIVATGAGLGAAGAYGAFFHALNHTLVKGMLFLSAGNILAAYGTKSVERVRGLARTLPWTGALWAAGLFAATGAPPFGTFVSEWTILRAAASGGRWGVLVFFLVALAVIFLGMSRAFLSMLQGPKVAAERPLEPASAWIPPLVLGAAALALGLGAPGFLDRILKEAAGLP
jgi:hydrogenase-4 component F